MTGSEFDKGRSEDKKYHIVTKEGQDLLLRMSESKYYDDKKEEFEIIEKLSELDFEMSTAFKYGPCTQGVYMVLGWIKIIS